MQAISKASNPPAVSTARCGESPADDVETPVAGRAEAATAANVTRALRSLPRAGSGVEPVRNRWSAKGYELTLQPTAYAAQADEELVTLSGHEDVEPNVIKLYFGGSRLLFKPQGSNFDVQSNAWIDAHAGVPLRPSKPTAALGTVPLLRPRPIPESFPEARQVPKAAFSFWAGAAPPDAYLENVRHNAAVLEKSGYTFTLVMDADQAIVKQTRRALGAGGSSWFGRRKAGPIHVERWSDSVKSLLKPGEFSRQDQSLVAEALSNYETIAALGFYASAADLARALLLFQRGGVYLDMDDRLPGTFDGVLLADSHMVWSPYTYRPFQDADPYLNNNMLAVQARSPIFARMLSLSNERLARGGHAEMARVAQSGAGLTEAQTKRLSASEKVRRARLERRNAIFKNTGPSLLTDAVRQVAPGFYRYWHDILDYREVVGFVLTHPDYLARIDETMMPLQAAFDRTALGASSWGHTPTPRRRGTPLSTPS
jgi:hypothetical protein